MNRPPRSRAAVSVSKLSKGRGLAASAPGRLRSVLCQALRPPRSRAAVCSCCRTRAGSRREGRSYLRPCALQTLGLPAGVAISRISRVSPVNTIGVWSGRNLPPRQPSHTPRAAGRRPRLLHLSGSPLVSTSGAWLGQCLPPRRPHGCKAIVAWPGAFVNLCPIPRAIHFAHDEQVGKVAQRRAAFVEPVGGLHRRRCRFAIGRQIDRLSAGDERRPSAPHTVRERPRAIRPSPRPARPPAAADIRPRGDSRNAGR